MRHIQNRDEHALPENANHQTIIYAQTTSLIPYKRNARKHSKKQLKQIAKSIE